MYVNLVGLLLRLMGRAVGFCVGLVLAALGGLLCCTIIGAVGDTAIAESGMPAHLHLEVSLNGMLVDPAEYLPQL